MDVIPVIDIKAGQVVLAQGGRRDDYRPIQTRLSATSRPHDVARGLLALFPFRALYVADLDAIGGGTPNDVALDHIADALPELAVWVDNGANDVTAARHWLAQRPEALVIGSETQRDAALAKLDTRTLLSLDFRGDAFLGPQQLLDDENAWPDRLIVMTLARVGSALGPDCARVAAIKQRAGERRVYAAGGARTIDDLRRLDAVGAAGVLVATALHTGEISPGDLAEIARR